MTKLSHKALKEMGKTLGGLFFDGNIYAHENRAHYLTCVPYNAENDDYINEAKRHEPEIASLIDEIIKSGANGARREQLAYSCGIYGNTGQLHKIDLYKDDEIVRTIFLYC